MRRLISLCLVVLLTACAIPETRVSTGATRPSLAIKGAPANAMLIVDGLSMGAAAQYDGAPKVLLIEEGVHQVEIRQAETVVHAEEIFVASGETRTITLHTGAR